MRPSRRVAILFVTTLLSTRLLLAQSDISSGTVSPVVGRGDGPAFSELTKVPGRVSQSRDFQQQSDESCTPPALIGPGDATGAVSVASPVRFRWTRVGEADRYRVVYSLEGGTGKEIVLGETRQTELVADVPLGLIKWKVYTVKDSGCEANSTGLKFLCTGPAGCVQPSVSVLPSSARINAGQRVTLTAMANGTAPLGIQWFEGNAGDRRKPAGSGTSFTSAPLTASTSFWCETTNACGTVESPTVAVEVCTTPSITTHPQNTSITAGQSATLTVSASGTAPLSYQWFEGVTPVGTNAATFNTGALTSTKSYRVEVRNACGTVTSNTATVSVCTPPAITTHPQSSSITEGQSAALGVSASGTAPLTYQWFEGVTPVGTNSATFDTGALTSTKSYRVEVRNACGMVTSSTATVTVTKSCTAPAITAQPQSSSITEGQSATLGVSATGTAPLSYQWFEGVTPVGTNSPTFDTGALTSTKSYRVEVRNACGVVTSSTATVTVTKSCTAPAITAHPQSTTITEGQAATLTVAASGTAPLTYQWFEGVTPVGTNSATFNTGALTSTKSYRVEVRNACGMVTSSTATVTVCTAPAIAAHPQSTSVTEGQGVTLSVSATGTAPLSYQWFEGVTPVGTNSPTFDTGALTSTKSYRVEVRNGCGTVTSSTATVTVTKSCVAPAIVTQPRGTTIARGQSATLTVVANGTAPLTYQWFEGVTPIGTPIGTSDRSLTTGPLDATTAYRVEVRNECGLVSSEVATVTVGQCALPATAPVPSSVAVVTSGVEYAIRWAAVDGASHYEIEESEDDAFSIARAQRVTVPMAVYRHETPGATSRFYRVRAIAACDGSAGPFSSTVRVAIVPAPRTHSGADVVVPHGTVSKVATTVTVDVDPSATSFAASASEEWLAVEPAAGGVPPSGKLTFTLTFDPTELLHGTSVASLRIVLTGGSTSGLTTNGSSSVTTPISISLVTPVSPVGNGPSAQGETLIIPAVAHADGNNSRWQSDVRIAHTYPTAVRYQLTFTPSGNDRASSLQTEVVVSPAQTIALDDVLARWFGSGMASLGQTGVLSIRALDAKTQGQTFATSRLFNVTDAGSFGQFIPAVPLKQFLAGSVTPSMSRQSLVGLAQSAGYRTNMGIVEGSGSPATAVLEVFNGAGTKIFDTTLALKPGEHKQISSILASQNIDTTNARIDVRIVSAVGSVYGYASVVDNTTGDPSFVPPVDATAARARNYTIAGVADLTTATGKWQTDLRLFNGGPASVPVTLAFFPQGVSDPAATREVTVQPGEILALDDVLQSFFGIRSAGGSLRITTATDSALVPAARTYHHRPDASYGQFVPAATADSAASLGTRALRILQAEESVRFRTNIGLTEVTGKPATVEVTASVPGRKTSPTLRVDLKANEFVQLNSLMRSMGMDDAYNASLSVKVIGGSGKVIAYGSVVDNATFDPTYVMAQ